MYCSACGTAVAQGISYCNLCGAKLSAAESADVMRASELSLDSLVWAIVSVFIVGLGTTIGLMAMMKDLLDFSQGLIITFTLLSFLLMFAIEGVLIWLLLSRRSGVKEMDDTQRLKEFATKELGAAQPLPEPVPSITEQTTRPFELIYREQKSR